jgi:hypothetical protein
MTEPHQISGPHQISEPVRRVLARDDLLMTAADADIAVGIVRDRESLAQQSKDEKSLFAVALDHHLAIAESDEGPTERSKAYRHAGVILRFCTMVDIPVDDRRYTAEQLHAKSLAVLTNPADPDAEPKNRAGYAFNLYRAARNLRLNEDFDEAQRLAAIAKDKLNGSGAEPYAIHLLFELGANYISQGQAADVEDLLREWSSLWKTRAAGFSTRYRCEFVEALAWWEQDEARALAGLDSALSRAKGRLKPEESTQDSVQLDGGLAELSVTLAKAEYLAATERSAADHAEAVRLGGRALDIADTVRGRWRVIARSRAPLAVVFHRIYGDIALLADRLTVPEAAKLGLRVALSAKQTGFAARMRAGRHTLMNSTVEGIIDDINAIEKGGRPGRMHQDLDVLRFQLQEAVSRMLADTILPVPRTLDELTNVIGSRYALDYVELTGSLARTRHLFRTLIEPNGLITFEEFTPDPYYRDFFERARENSDWPLLLPRSVSEPSTRDLKSAAAVEAVRFDWRKLATSVLPPVLMDRLSTDREPIELLISAHSWLSLVPWAALEVDDAKTRLICQAVITQTPVLTCLQHRRPPRVEGKALIRLVGDGEGVNVRQERVAWGLPSTLDSQPLSECNIPGPDATPSLCEERLTEALRLGDAGSFLHIASHGTGQGLDQFLEIPDERISFGAALSLKWPASVLMASCHVGQVINTGEAEPLSMVMAVLTGGAQCVVAGIATVGDIGTGAAASHIVSMIRTAPISLDVALREAQLAAVDKADELQWALLAAYTQ